MEKTFGDVVRIFIVIHMFMMTSMFAGPHENRVLEGSGAEDEREQAHRQPGAKSHMRKETVITKGDTEAGRGQHDPEYCEVKPIETEIPQVKRYCCDREKNGADQERTRRPIDTVKRDSEHQMSSLLLLRPKLFTRPK